MVELSLGDGLDTVSVVTPYEHLAIGHKVIVAPERSKVGGTRVKKTKVHGEWNAGVLCGMAEMGWLDGAPEECIILEGASWTAGDYAPLEKPTGESAIVVDADAESRSLGSNEDVGSEKELCDAGGFGFDSVREAYAEMGAVAFYAEHGNNYTNPHEKVLFAALCRALTEWEAAGLLATATAAEEPAVPFRRVLDLACGSGEASLALQQWADGRAGVAEQLEAADPYTYEAYERRTGRRAHRWSFEDIASAGTLDDLPVYDAVLCSFCLHLLDRSYLVMTLKALAESAHLLVVLSPHKRPVIDPKTGWDEVGCVLQDRVRVRLLRSRMVRPS